MAERKANSKCLQNFVFAMDSRELRPKPKLISFRDRAHRTKRFFFPPRCAFFSLHIRFSNGKEGEEQHKKFQNSTRSSFQLLVECAFWRCRAGSKSLLAGFAQRIWKLISFFVSHYHEIYIFFSPFVVFFFSRRGIFIRPAD